jgi:hypothetical protein
MKIHLYYALIAIGLLQSIGYILHIKPIRQLGMVSGSSPLPLVFTDVKGVETFASDFFIQYQNKAGQWQEIQITPSLYAKLQGPYNRRNVYGAAISYGPILKQALWQAVFDYGFCKQVLIKEMQLPLDATNFAIRIKTNTAGRNNEWILKPSCSP